MDNKFENSIFGIACQTFGAIGGIVSFFLVFNVFTEARVRDDIYPEQFIPALTVALASATIGAIGTTAIQTKKQTILLQSLVEK